MTLHPSCYRCYSKLTKVDNKSCCDEAEARKGVADTIDLVGHWGRKALAGTTDNEVYKFLKFLTV